MPCFLKKMLIYRYCSIKKRERTVYISITDQSNGFTSTKYSMKITIASGIVTMAITIVTVNTCDICFDTCLTLFTECVAFCIMLRIMFITFVYEVNNCVIDCAKDLEILHNLL